MRSGGGHVSDVERERIARVRFTDGTAQNPPPHRLQLPQHPRPAAEGVRLPLVREPTAATARRHQRLGVHIQQRRISRNGPIQTGRGAQIHPRHPQRMLSSRQMPAHLQILSLDHSNQFIFKNIFPRWRSDGHERWIHSHSLYRSCYISSLCRQKTLAIYFAGRNSGGILFLLFWPRFISLSDGIRRSYTAVHLMDIHSKWRDWQS